MGLDAKLSADGSQFALSIAPVGTSGTLALLLFLNRSHRARLVPTC